MKLELLLAVILFSGWTLSLPQHLRQGSRISQYVHHQLLRQAPRSEQPVDKFNFIDIELLQLAAETEAGNVVLSPASVKTTLSMLWEGADGRTAQEIGLALRLNSRGRDKQEQQLHEYQQNLTFRASPLPEATPQSTLEVANHIFYSSHVSINPSYSDALGNYHAMATRVNMSDTAQAAGQINKWVSTATHGLVPTLVQSENLSDDPVMVLANAIYFQGTWMTAFDAALTQPACFHTDPVGECVPVQMMETMGSFRSKLIHELEATLLEMPYDDHRYSMLFLLPERKDGMPELMRNLAFANLLHVLNDDLEDSEYVVSIPQFAIEFNIDLVPVLNKLRVVDVFSPGANLTRMLTQDQQTQMKAAVSSVFHKAKIVVNERGATAAGATGALVVPLMGGPQPRFRADHPFLFFIRDLRSGGFLFAGRVSRPETPDAAAVVPPKGDAVPVVPVAENEAATKAPTGHAHSSGTSKRSQAPAVKESDINFPTNAPAVVV